jgi:hypothetical protein
VSISLGENQGVQIFKERVNQEPSLLLMFGFVRAGVGGHEAIQCIAQFPENPARSSGFPN